MKKILVILLLTLPLSTAWSQTASESFMMPGESIYLHQNSTMLMSGEYLFYKVYCLNNQTGTFSDLSKVAYVELVGKDGKPVFSHKVRLKNGAGAGDFFVPTTVPSGNYKLVAFTQWMRNLGVDSFFQNDIVLINPFHNNQGGLMKMASDSTEVAVKALRSEAQKTTPDSELRLEINPQTSGNRDRMELSVSQVPSDWHGNYSLSVRKISEKLHGPERKTAVAFEDSFKGREESVRVNPGTGMQLPELRGELVTGTVFSVETGEPVPNRRVALSIPGTNYLFKISSTKENGSFFFNVDESYANQQALVQVIGEDRDQFRVELDAFESPDYSSLSFSDFVLDESMEDYILERSVENQIQNAYAENRVDSIMKIEDFPPFFHTPSHEYYLDDYTRFPTIKETITEVIEQASTRQRKGKQFIHVRVYDDDVETGLNSLLLIDGLFIQDHNTVIEAKAFKIKKISVINQQYLYGSEVFEGIIAMESYEGDFIESLPELKAKDTQLFRPELAKEYYQQDYRYPQRFKRIPDYRSQLLWEPQFQLDGSSKDLSFYTSDVKGSFEVILEGFNEKGKPLSLRKVIEVK